MFNFFKKKDRTKNSETNIANKEKENVNAYASAESADDFSYAGARGSAGARAKKGGLTARVKAVICAAVVGVAALVGGATIMGVNSVSAGELADLEASSSLEASSTVEAPKQEAETVADTWTNLSGTVSSTTWSNVNYKLSGNVYITGQINVTGTVKLDLNGYILKGFTTTGANLFRIDSANVSFTISDSRPTVKHYYKKGASQQYVYDFFVNGTNTEYTLNDTSTYLEGGIITGQYSGTAGWSTLYINGSGTNITLNGGTFAGNTCGSSVGTMRVNSGTATVNNFRFQGNNAGQVVLTESGGTANINGIIVTDNKSDYTVKNNGGTININGAQIYNNVFTSQGAVYSTNANLKMKGKIIVRGNMSTSGVSSNLFLSQKLVINGVISADSEIHFTPTAAGAITSGYGSSGNSSTQLNYFVSDSPEYAFSIVSNEISAVVLTNGVNPSGYTNYSGALPTGTWTNKMVRLTGNSYLTAQVVINGTCYIDLNGYILKGYDGGADAFSIQANAKLYIGDNRPTNPNYYVKQSTGQYKFIKSGNTTGYTSSDTSTSVKGGVITDFDFTTNMGLFYLNAANTYVYLNAGNVSGNSDSGYGLFAGINATSHIYINCNVEGNYQSNVYASSREGFIRTGGNVTIGSKGIIQNNVSTQPIIKANSGAVLDIISGTIINNIVTSQGTIALNSNATINMAGKVVINGNKTTAGVAVNLLLPKPINIVGALVASSVINFTPQTTGYVTSGFTDSGCGANEVAYFICNDTANYKFAYTGGEVYTINVNTTSNIPLVTPTTLTSSTTVGSGEYKLTGNVTHSTITIPTDGVTLIDLNGYTLTSSSGPAIQLTNPRAILVIQDSSSGKAGRIKGATYGVYVTGANTILKFVSGGVKASGNYGIYINNDSAVVSLTGITVEGNKGGVYRSGSYAVNNFLIKNSTIKNNTLTSGNGAGVYAANGVTLAGTTSIQSNTLNGAANNLYLPTNKKITLSESLSTSSTYKIGVTYQGFSKSDYSIFANLSTYPSSMTNSNKGNYVTSDKTDGFFYYSSNQCYLFQGIKKPTAKAAQTYTGSALTLLENYTSSELNTKYTASLKFTPTGGTQTTATYSATGTAAGAYAYTFTSANSYKWEDHTTGSITVTATINRKSLTKPTLSTTSFTFNGDAKTAALSATNTGYSVTGNSATKAGSYTATVSLKDNNYQWSDNTRTNLSLTWKINKANVTKPSQNGALTYTGSAQSLNLVSNPTGKYFASASATTTTTGNLFTLTGNSQTKAGSYTAKATLVDTANYQWADGTTTAVDVSWTINKKGITVKPEQATSLPTYNGTAQSVTLKTAAPTGAYFATTAATTASNGALFTLSNNTATEAGTHTATATLADSANYKWAFTGAPTGANESAPYNFNWTINKLAVDKPSLAVKEFTFSGLEKRVTLSAAIPTDSATPGVPLYTFEGVQTGTTVGSYTAVCKLTNTTSLIWRGGDASDFELPWSIKKLTAALPALKANTFTFSGNNITVELVNIPTDETGAALFSLGGDVTQKNAAEYTAVVTIENSDNVAWAGGTVTGNTYNLTWKINKAVIASANKPEQTGTITYNGNTAVVALRAAIPEGQYVDGTETKTGALFSLSGNSAINAGTHTATATLTDPANYKWEWITDSATESAPYSFDWAIQKKGVTVKPEQGAAIIYNGEEQTLGLLNPIETDLIVNGTGGNLYVLSGNAQTDADTYTATATLADATNYKWAWAGAPTGANESAPYDFTWAIGKATPTYNTNNVKQDQELYIGQIVSQLNDSRPDMNFCEKWTATYNAAVGLDNLCAGVYTITGIFANTAAQDKVTATTTKLTYTFTPTDTKNFASFDGEVNVVATQLYLTFKAYVKTSATQLNSDLKVPVDYASTYTLSDYLNETGAVVYGGYDAHYYNVETTGTETELTSGKIENITNTSGSAKTTVYVKWVARNDTQYTIWFIRQYSSGLNRGTYPDAANYEDLVLNTTDNLVKKFVVNGLTDEQTNFDKSVALWNNTTASMSFDNFKLHYTLDEAKCVYPIVSGEEGNETNVYIFFKNELYTVNFYANGGSTTGADASRVEMTKVYYYGEAIGDPFAGLNAELTKRKAAFDGWYYNPEFTGSKIEFSNTVNNLVGTVENGATTINIYAKWLADTYTITYNYIDDNQTNKIFTYDDVRKALVVEGTYFGNYAESYYQITAANNPATYTADITDNITLLAPTAEGFEFKGWYDANGRAVTRIVVGSEGARELFARWEAKSYKVNFDANGGTVSPKSKNYKTGSAFGTLPTPRRDGYDFLYWEGAINPSMSGANEFGANDTCFIKGEITVTAVWQQITKSYSVTYRLQNTDGTYTEMDDEVATLTVTNSVDGTPYGPADEIPAGTVIRVSVEANSAYGYSFVNLTRNGKGMSNNSNYTLKDVVDFVVTVRETRFNINYYYTDCQVLNDVGWPRIFTASSTSEALPNENDFAKVGYELEGWVLQLDGGEVDEEVLTNVGDLRYALFDRFEELRSVTLVAKWNPLQTTLYTYTQDNSGAWGPADSLDVTVDETYELYYVEAPLGYKLVGWATTQGSNAVAYPVNDDGYAYIKINAEDSDNESTSLNKIYAVYVLDGNGYMLITGQNEFTYDGQEHTIVATPYPKFNFEVDPELVLHYQWQKVDADGSVENLGNWIEITADNADEYPDFAVPYTVKNVKDSGIYQCTLSTYSTSSGTATETEIVAQVEVKIEKALYTGVSFDATTSEYDGQVHANHVTYRDGTEIKTEERGYFTLPDGSQVNVKYTATLDGVVADVRNAGTYIITADFTMSPDTNYNPLPMLTARYTVTQKEINNVSFAINKGATETTTNIPVKDADGNYQFVNDYDGNWYRVSATTTDLVAGDSVTIDLDGDLARAVGNYEAYVTGTLSGAQAGNYTVNVRGATSQAYSIGVANHDLSQVRFADENVSFDGANHVLQVVYNDGTTNIAVEEGGELVLPSGTFTVNYAVTYTPVSSFVGSTPTLTNGGRHAGVYTVTATFTEHDADGSYNPIDPITRTLTIEQADFFASYDRTTLLGSFVSGSDTFGTDKYKFLFIDGTDPVSGLTLNDLDRFSIIYNYNLVTGGVYTPIIAGTEASIRAANFAGLHNSGYYRISADIEFLTGEDINNYQIIPQIVIYFTIPSADVDHIVVNMNTSFADGLWYGEDFNLGAIESIDVWYKNSDGADRYTGEKLASATILEIMGEDADGVPTSFAAFEGFTHVGSYDVAVYFLGKYYKINVFVKQEITSIDYWEYSYDGENYFEIPADGVEYNEEGISFRAVFTAVDKDGVEKTEYVVATVKDALIQDGKNLLVVNSTDSPYVLVAGASWLDGDDGLEYYQIHYNRNSITTEFNVIKNKQGSVEWYYKGYASDGVTVVETLITDAMLDADGNYTLDYTGRNQSGSIVAKFRGTEIHWESDNYDANEGSVLNEAGVYILTVTETFANYQPQNDVLYISIRPKDLSGNATLWEYKNADGVWVDVNDGDMPIYSGEEVELRVTITLDTILDNSDPDNIIYDTAQLPVIAESLSGVDLAADGGIINVGQYRLTCGMGNFYTDATATIEIMPKELELTWSYGTDADGEPIAGFTYNGEEQTYVVGNVNGVGIDADEVVVEIIGNVQKNAGTYNPTAQLKSDYAANYRLTNIGGEFTIEKLEVKFDWQYDTTPYSGEPQAPTYTFANIAECDEGEIGFSHTYYNGDGAIIGALGIISTGSYKMEVELVGSRTVVSNYYFGDKTATTVVIPKEFEIVTADIGSFINEVHYVEYPTKIDVTYKLLREEKMTISFIDGRNIPGHFVFYTDATYTEVLDGDEAIPANRYGSQKFYYQYIPDDLSCYNPYNGAINISVYRDTYKVGTAENGYNTLYISFDGVPTSYYLGQTVSTTGLRVYRMYESFYVEDGVIYGKSEELNNSDCTFYFDMMNDTSLNNVPANGYVIAKNSFESGSLKTVFRLRARYTLSGTTTMLYGQATIDALSARPVSITLDEDETPVKKIWYVGETIRANDYKFVVVDENNEKISLNGGADIELSMGVTSAMLTFTDDYIGDYELTFIYLGVFTKINIEVRAKEVLDVQVKETTYAKYIADDVVAKEMPRISFRQDGELFADNELEGVHVTYIIRFVPEGGTTSSVVTAINKLGTYTITASFTFTKENVRYQTNREPVAYYVIVKDMVYIVDYSPLEGDDLRSTYTGNEVNYKGTLNAIYDVEENSLPLSTAVIEYTITNANGKKVDNIVDAGKYTVDVVITAEYEGEMIEIDSYTYQIIVIRVTDNTGTLTISDVVEGTPVNPQVTANFGAADAVFEYLVDGVWTTTVPTAVGNYSVRASIAETDNYNGVNMPAQTFSINYKSVVSDGKNEDGENYVEVTGGNGVRPGVEIEATPIIDEEIVEITVENQQVLHGYDVTVKSGVVDGAQTLKLLISGEYRGRTDLKVYCIDADGNVTDMNAVIDGNYMVFETTNVAARFIIVCSPESLAGYIAGVVIMGVAVIGLAVACTLLGIKKKKEVA